MPIRVTDTIYHAEKRFLLIEPNGLLMIVGMDWGCCFRWVGVRHERPTGHSFASTVFSQSPWHVLSPGEVATHLAVDPDAGLSTDEAAPS